MMIPDAIVMVHTAYGSNAALNAPSVIATVAPEPVVPIEKVVEPQPLLYDNVPGVFRVKYGRTNVITSFNFNCTFKVKVKDTVDGAVVTGFENVSLVPVSIGVVGTLTAFEYVIGAVPMFLADANVTATLLSV